MTEAERKEAALAEYRSKLQKHKEVDTKVLLVQGCVQGCCVRGCWLLWLGESP